MAEAFMALLHRPGDETDDGMFELIVEAAEQNEIDVTWRQVKFNLAEEHLAWSADHPLRF
jgi:predicted 3-demethylubiquinone-9 3-methyltransferase (glyoxalase superfamily)